MTPQFLKIVDKEADCSSGIVPIDILSIKMLKIEAQSLRKIHGSNPYSDYLEKWHARPDYISARAMGWAMDSKFQASDGSFQPQSSVDKAKRDREVRLEIKKRIKQKARSHETHRLIYELASTESEPHAVAQHTLPIYAYDDVKNQISHAIQWLDRFALELDRHEQASNDSPRPSKQGSNDIKGNK